MNMLQNPQICISIYWYAINELTTILEKRTDSQYSSQIYRISQEYNAMVRSRGGEKLGKERTEWNRSGGKKYTLRIMNKFYWKFQVRKIINSFTENFKQKKYNAPKIKWKCLIKTSLSLRSQIMSIYVSVSPMDHTTACDIVHAELNVSELTKILEGHKLRVKSRVKIYSVQYLVYNTLTQTILGASAQRRKACVFWTFSS